MKTTPMKSMSVQNMPTRTLTFRLLSGLALGGILAMGSPVGAARHRTVPVDPQYAKQQAAEAKVTNEKSLLKTQRMVAKESDPDAPPPPRHYFPRPPQGDLPKPQR